MTKPRRIQRKMLKGWRLPPQTVYVGRGSKWGNPFPFEHQRYLGKAWAVDAYAHWLATSLKGMALLRNHLHELRGKNLACWWRASRAMPISCSRSPTERPLSPRSARIRWPRRGPRKNGGPTFVRPPFRLSHPFAIRGTSVRSGAGCP